MVIYPCIMWDVARLMNLGCITNGGAPKRYKLAYKPHEYYRYITNKNHSYWSYVHQLSYRTGAPACIVFLNWD